MLKSPVLSVPVQRALAGTTATGGAMQSGDIHGWNGWQASEGADQASRIFQGQPSEGADQSTVYGFTNLNGQPSEGADQSYMDGHVSHYIVSEGADQASRIFQGQPSEG